MNWYEKLKEGLHDRGFLQSKVDPCIFISKNILVLTYVDDCIILGKDGARIKELIKSLANGEEKFDLTDEGEIKNYLGVDFNKNDDGSFELRQPFLIERIIKALNFNAEMKSTKNPTVKPPLHKDANGPKRKHNWHYRSVIGMLNYLKKSTHPEIAYAVHQCACFCKAPKLSQERAVHRIVCYLIGTKERGLIFKPYKNYGIECFVDADSVGNWNSMEGSDPVFVLS